MAKTDYRTMFDKDFIGAWSLPENKDVTVTIKKVVGGQLTGVGGRKTRKPVIYMNGTEKGFALNATNSKTVAALYGNYVEDWVGKRISLFRTTTTFGSEQMECVRIRPKVTSKSSNDEGQISDAPPPPPPDRLGDEDPSPPPPDHTPPPAAATNPHEGTAKMLVTKVNECLSERSLTAALSDYAEEIDVLRTEAPGLHERVQTAIEERRAHFKTK